MIGHHKIILASQSPRRLDLLSTLMGDLAIPCLICVHPANIDESRLPDESPMAHVQRLASEKAATVARMYTQEKSVTLIVAADTIVWLPNGTILGKPTDRQDASAMLHALSASTHTATTACTILFRNCRLSGHDVPAWQTHHLVDSTQVTFRQLSEHDIAEYVQTSAPYDKAGGYGIQGHANTFVKSLAGSMNTVIGLPTEQLASQIAQLFKSTFGDIIPV